MGSLDSFQPVLIGKVFDLIESKLEADQQTRVKQLAQYLLNNISMDDLTERTESDLYGAIMSLWQHLNEVKPDQTSVRTFNPSVSGKGWQSRHTIVEIIVPDSSFLVDSIKMCLVRLELTTHIMLNGPTLIERDAEQQVISINGEKGNLYSLFHIEIDRIDDAEKLDHLHQQLEQVLKDTALVVQDWKPMAMQLNKVIAELEKQVKQIPVEKDRFDETLEYLRWLGNHNFTFLGYKEYDLVKEKDETYLSPTNAPGLGLFSNQERVRKVNLANFTDLAREEAAKPFLLILTKGNGQSRIHRPAYNDYIGIKKFDKDGKVVGEHRFTGLYTSSVYNQTVGSIPLVREKVERILSASRYLKGSYAYKALHNILENYPRDELLQATEEELLKVGMGVVQMQDRDLLRLFIRRDPFGRFYSCMVYVGKDRHTTELRRRTQEILAEYLGSVNEVDYTVNFSEGSLARTHYIVRVENNNAEFDVKKIEQNLKEASTNWNDRLKHAIHADVGETKGLALTKEYVRAFPPSYKEAMLPSTALADIEQLEALSENYKLGMLFYRPQEESTDSKLVKLKLYHKSDPIYLSDVMPMLENLGLRVIDEAPYEITKTNGDSYWILDFSMLHKSDQVLDIASCRDRFQQAFAGIWNGEIENDGFNRLVLSADLAAREVCILRAYARYMRQVGFPFSQQYIEDTLYHYPNLATLLVELFEIRFKPDQLDREHAQKNASDSLLEQLDSVVSLDDDRILRRYMEMICASLRTNYFQTDDAGLHKPWLSIKLNPKAIPDIPAPLPAFEIFVYAPDVEGIHMRGGKVARGGLRWSDRQEDFRTEILGLVKAQQVKNTVIVPVGAKGGFVCKKQHLLTSRDDIFTEGQRCYKQFIRGLLDITDNIIEGEIAAPLQVVRHDADDPYLVVAADKGTATFSDLANSVSEEYHFWLSDAFASGGSNGYDHKAMGITAKGGWESVKRHFRELGIDCQTTPFTAAGIGDMAGDVFGNGMLLSQKTCLIAAFNHLHIFIDPNPDPQLSWVERDRLFKLPRSSWEDYNAKLISAGGGVFSRRAKSIPLSPEMQVMLDTKATTLAPNELIKLILKMQVDLMWNGGIGTYVKSHSETHSDVGDRANDGVRINGKELRAKVVGEGGNLGMTQLGRVEYALNGGRVNTDFVDNVGGVDCSDNEVNIKIFLNTLVAAGDLTFKQRNSLLQSMQDEVGDIVINDAYQQSESISVTEILGEGLVKEQVRFIHALEKMGSLDRALEYLPDDETLLEREKRGVGLTRPEISVLVAYGKMTLKELLAVDAISEDPFHHAHLVQYFPSKLRGHYESRLNEHPLRKEIIATSLANQIVNEVGCNFTSRLQEETGCEVVEIVNAYSAARVIFKLDQTMEQVRLLDNVASSQSQYEVFNALRRMMRRTTRWLLRNHMGKQSAAELIALYQTDVEVISHDLDKFLVKSEVDDHQKVAEQWIKKSMDPTIASYVSSLSSLYSALDICAVARECQISVERAAKLYFHLGTKLSLHWFLDQINRQAVDNNWQALARAAFREDLDLQQRMLTAQVISCSCVEENEDDLAQITTWMKTNHRSLLRWNNILNEFKVGGVHEFAKFSVALRELALLNLNCAANE
jgi:glutamate dehydrogenase